MKATQRGIGMVETMLSIVAGIVIVAAGATFAVKLRTEAQASSAISAVSEIQSAMQELFGQATRGYPAGLDVVEYLREHRRAPALRVTPTGCFEIDTTTDLCLSVPDDGGGRGIGYTMTYLQKVGGRRAETCQRLVDTLKPQLLEIRVGALEPRDVDGRLLEGVAWDAFWQPLCANPVIIEATLR